MKILRGMNMMDESKEKSNQSSAPKFTAPNSQNSMPKFTAPNSQNSAPKFTAPGDQNSASKFTASKGQSSAPKFTAPGNQGSAPKFTAPRQQSSPPRFTAPGQQSNDMRFQNQRNQYTNVQCCLYHPHNRAVMKCDQCGRPICEACKDSWQLTDGKHVCFDCASALVQEDVDMAKMKRSKIRLKIILGIVCAIVCGILSCIPIFLGTEDSATAESMIVRFFFVLFGAALPIYFPIFKRICSWIWRLIRWKPEMFERNIIINYIFQFIKDVLITFAVAGFLMVFTIFMEISPIVATVLAIGDIVRYSKANALVKRNQEILQRLSDRMEYIRVHSEEGGDFDTLANDERMQNNQFAQAVRRNGYSGASKAFADEAQEMADNDRIIKKFVLNEYGELVRAA